MKKGFSPSEAISYGWETFKKNVWLFVVLAILTSAISSISNIFTPEKSNTYLVVMSEIIGFVLSILVSVGVTKISLRIYDGEKARLGEVFNYSRYGVRYFVVSILMALIVILGLLPLLVIGGIWAFAPYLKPLSPILPFIPGVIWAIRVGGKEVKKNGWYFFALLLAPWLVWAIQFSYAYYFIIDKDAKIVESLVKSSALTKQAKLDLVAFGVLQVFVMLVGFLCLFVGIFVAIPVLWISEVYVYRKLLEQTKFDEKKKVNTAEAAA